MSSESQATGLAVATILLLVSVPAVNEEAAAGAVIKGKRSITCQGLYSQWYGLEHS